LVDGSPKVWVNDVNRDGAIIKADHDQAILVCGLRRGGRYYFALDVTDPRSPEIPKEWAEWGMWLESPGDEEDEGQWQGTGVIGPDMTRDHDQEDATYPYAEMGYSFATPVFGIINDSGTVKDVFFIGAGYDLNQDRENPLSSDETMGRGIYLVDVLTGSLFWRWTRAETFDMEWSIPSDVAAIDTTASGLIDRLYVGDMGGRVWRFDLSSPDQGNWTKRILFTANNLIDEGRKIFYPPDVTQEETYEMVFFGTGDRASPNREIPINGLYVVKDRNDNSNLDEDDLTDVTDDLLQASGDENLKNQIRSNLENDEGWYIRLEENLGEKVLAPPVVFGGVVCYTTFTPTEGSIEDPCVLGGGTARLYALNYRTGEAAFNFDTSAPAVGRSDRSLVIGSAIPSGLAIAILQGKPAGYIGVGGGILRANIGNPTPLCRTYWRHLLK
jgi:type IV pilus assembly protein PilY1